MEDFYEARFALVENNTVGLFGVFDGKHTMCCFLFIFVFPVFLINS